MIKLIICIVIISGCSAAGFIKADEFKARTKELENILEVFKLLQIEINYRKEPLQPMFKKLYLQKVCWFTDVLNECSLNLLKGYDLKQSWNCALQYKMNLCPLKKEDIEILEDIALGLGKSDSQSQINIINPATERIKTKLKEATEKEAKLGKMYKSLGFAAGIIIVIMFI